MTDQYVDELLADLDRALAVEPSASVAARVRTSVAHDAGVGWFGRRWPAIAVGAAALVVLAVIVRPGFDDPPVPNPLPAASAEVKPVAAPAAAPLPPVRVRGERKPEPEVLVSPSQRLALDQLAAAVRDGRINSDSFPAEDEPTLLEIVTIRPIVPDVVKLQPWNHRPEIVY